jgi:hypothetical protein
MVLRAVSNVDRVGWGITPKRKKRPAALPQGVLMLAIQSNKLSWFSSFLILYSRLRCLFAPDAKSMHDIATLRMNMIYKVKLVK